MPRGRKPRTWVKMDCEGILRGSINYLFLAQNYNGVDVKDVASLACQAIWVKMIALSEVCGGRPGYIEDNNNTGLPHRYISQELHCPLVLLEVVLKTMSEDGAIEIDGAGSIHLVNFDHYQFSEYDRQRPYREARKQKSQDPDKYFTGKYGSNTCRTAEDVKKLKKEKVD